MPSHNHYPVMLNEVMEMFAQANIEQPKNYLDGTFGRGGHAEAISNKFPELDIYALDKDKEAVDYAKDKFASKAKSKKSN